MKSFLKPLSFLYDQIVGVKNSLYDRGLVGVYKAPVPVVSIGNLTVGGTGKTPVTDFCLKALVAQGKKVAVISRSYRAGASAPCLVDVQRSDAAQFFGDEPVLLAQRNPEVSVFVGPSKWQTARFAATEDKFDIFIVDDGFQHRRLHRDLNIVILDATEVLPNYAVLPEGRARESWHNLNRADLIVITKCNLASDDEFKALSERLPPQKEVLFFGYEIKSLVNAADQSLRAVAETQGKNFFLVSAIARPDVFEKMMGEVGTISKKSLHYRDHHQYTSEDVRHIQEEFKKSHADYLVATEKDIVKLRGLFANPEILWGAALEVQELSQKGRLHEVIRQIIH